MAATRSRYFAGISKNTVLLALASLFADISSLSIAEGEFTSRVEHLHTMTRTPEKALAGSSKRRVHRYVSDVGHASLPYEEGDHSHASSARLSTRAFR